MSVHFGYLWKTACVGRFYFILSFPLTQYFSFTSTILLSLFCKVIRDFVWVLYSFHSLKILLFFPFGNIILPSFTVVLNCFYFLPTFLTFHSLSLGNPCVFSYLWNMGAFSSLSSFCSFTAFFLHFFFFFALSIRLLFTPVFCLGLLRVLVYVA